MTKEKTKVLNCSETMNSQKHMGTKDHSKNIKLNSPRILCFYSFDDHGHCWWNTMTTNWACGLALQPMFDTNQMENMVANWEN